MKRHPNPWIVIPSVLMGVLAGVLGWVVTDVSCDQAETPGMVAGCTGWAIFFAVLSFLVVTIGVALMLVLVYRSLAEWREGQQQR